jgi:hypothetical protein
MLGPPIFIGNISKLRVWPRWHLSAMSSTPCGHSFASEALRLFISDTIACLDTSAAVRA